MKLLQKGNIEEVNEGCIEKQKAVYRLLITLHSHFIDNESVILKCVCMARKHASILDLPPEDLTRLAQKTGRTVAELRASAEQLPPTEDHPISEHMQAKMNSGSYSTKP